MEATLVVVEATLVALGPGPSLPPSIPGGLPAVQPQRSPLLLGRPPPFNLKFKGPLILRCSLTFFPSIPPPKEGAPASVDPPSV